MKKIPYSRQSVDESDLEKVREALRSDWLTQGPCVREFEEALCKYTGSKYAAAVSSGTAALHLSMLALGAGNGDKIITSPITFSASASCAIYVGASPLFVDIDNTTYQMDAGRLRRFLEIPSQRDRVKAVVLVHFMGAVADVLEVRKICSRYGIKVVEDAAHALGAEYRPGPGSRWKKVGSCSHSDMAIFSFHPIKQITTGEGGAVLTNDRRLYQKVLRLRHHGIKKTRPEFWSYDITALGFNYRITDFQCALGISQLKRLDNMIEAKRGIVSRYNDGLSGIKGITLPYEREGTRASYHLYVIRVPAERRDSLYKYLRDADIYTQVNYIPVYLFSYYRKAFGYKRRDYPAAENYFKECLSLPLYAGLSYSDQGRVIKRIKRFFKDE